MAVAGKKRKGVVAVIRERGRKVYERVVRLLVFLLLRNAESAQYCQVAIHELKVKSL